MRIAGLTAIVITVLAATLISPAARAQDDGPTPADIARHCVQEMHGVAAHACQGMKTLAEHGIKRMIELKRAGAPDRVLYEVASETTERIAHVADEARDRINRITAVCVRHLQKLGAPRRVIEFVKEGRKSAVGAVRNCAHKTRRAVWRAFAFLSESIELEEAA